MLRPDDAARLAATAEALHCPAQAIDRMQPWMAELTLSVAEDARSGASAASDSAIAVPATILLRITLDRRLGRGELAGSHRLYDQQPGRDPALQQAAHGMSIGRREFRCQ